MKPKKVRELINDALYAQIHANGIKRDMPQPFHIQGPPGIGKSAIPKMICAEMKVGFIDNRPALRDPTDYRGIPAIVENRAVWLQPSDLPTPWYCLICERPLSETQALERDSAPDSVLRACKFCGSPTVDAGILFLDELDAAQPTTQA